jgi:hypothetical protein
VLRRTFIHLNSTSIESHNGDDATKDRNNTVEVGLSFTTTAYYFVSHHFDKLGAIPQKQKNDKFMHIKITTSAKTLHCLTVTMKSMRSSSHLPPPEHAEIITFHNCMQMMILYRLIKFWFGKQDAGRA